MEKSCFCSIATDNTLFLEEERRLATGLFRRFLIENNPNVDTSVFGSTESRSKIWVGKRKHGNKDFFGCFVDSVDERLKSCFSVVWMEVYGEC